MTNHISRPIGRRALAQGLAWATPAVLASAAIPAYASSLCETAAPVSFRNTQTWTIRNPNAPMYSPGAFGTYPHNRRDFYWTLSTTTAHTPQTAIVTGEFIASNNDDSPLNTRCGTYQMKVDLVSARGQARTEALRLYPRLSFKLIDPDGNIVPGTEQSFTTRLGATDATVLPTSTGYSATRPRFLTAAVPVKFTPKPGKYTFRVELTASSNYDPVTRTADRNKESDGLGVSAPVFEYIGK